MSLAVGIVGLGKIASFHVEALQRIPNVEVVGGMDVEAGKQLFFHGLPLPVYDSIEGLLAHKPDVVIVATPTATHHEVCKAVLNHALHPTRILVEKPASHSISQVADLVGNSTANITVDVIYHASYAPEVLWAVERYEEWHSQFGAITDFDMFFSDPLRDMDLELRNRVYVNSWLDSGINALSVCARFIRPTRVEDLTVSDVRGSVYSASVLFQCEAVEGRGKVRTSWDVLEAAKSSVFSFQSGARLIFDHQHISSRLQVGEETKESYRYAGTTPRLVLHYLNVFSSLLGDGAFRHRFDSLELHHLLIDPA